MTDLWPLVEEEIQRQNPALVGLDMHTIETKWRRGAAEHGDLWTAWIDRDFDEQIEAERIDLICYRAMKNVARDLQGTPAPNRLPDGTTGTNRTPRIPDSEAATRGDTARTHWERHEWSPHASNQRRGGSEAPGGST